MFLSLSFQPIFNKSRPLESKVEVDIEVFDVKNFIIQSEDEPAINEQNLLRKIDEFQPNIILFSICFSRVSRLKILLENSGYLTKLRLKRELLLATKSGVILLDTHQEKIIDRVIQPENYHKSVVIHGPEGSGKSILGLEIVKIKVHQHYDQMNFTPEEGKNQIRVIVSACKSENESVDLLLDQLKRQLADSLSAICTIEYYDVPTRVAQNPKAFNAHGNIIRDLLERKSSNPELKKNAKTILMIDELHPEFELQDWKMYKPLNRNVQVVFCLKHGFNDAKLRNDQTLEYPEFESPINGHASEEISRYNVEDTFDHIIVGNLRDGNRNSNQIRTFNYYMLIHSSKLERRFLERSFRHHKKSFDSTKPIWVNLKNENAFLNYAENEKLLQGSGNVMLVYDPNAVQKESFEKVKKYCQNKMWICVQENEIVGSEASTVIIYDLKQFHFEAFSRAVQNLIIVTKDAKR